MIRLPDDEDSAHVERRLRREVAIWAKAQEHPPIFRHVPGHRVLIFVVLRLRPHRNLPENSSMGEQG
jgi:hypothetical protein